MDAQSLRFESHSYNVVAASLILTIVLDGQEAFRDMVRVVKGCGRNLSV
ncbi:methyltransferase domain-containing protein [Mesobacillus maritimus]